ncbi:hypothetical protein [Nesterenkonia cremea]|uniref:ATP-grasp domain-containing protein n=1 Tax=Nesterenkonia cremea TaxID=1882340 RepID=A0A917EPR9_9MICC|nr:hypothetical protein [Nesterenkonia cremea]GGE68169.1 hypothetical protein GCM10011401_14480 [Nesterenkonia cremea]
MASSASDTSSILERFITEYIVSRQSDFRETKRPQSHAALLQAALKRKKVKVQQVDAKHRNFCFGNDLVGGMDRMVTTLVSDLARHVAADKWLSKKHFWHQGLPVPDGQEFLAAEFSAAVSLLGSLRAPAVLKPVAASSGYGISLGLQNMEDLRRAWPRALDARLTGEGSRETLLLEEFREGLDVRVFVVGEQAVSVLVRVPVYVAGDGRSTVQDLLSGQARLRSGHKHLSSHTPQVTQEELGVQGLTPQTVLGPGEIRVLREQANIREGGLPVDVTDQTHQAVKELAVEALWAIPGLTAAAIDLVVPDLGSSEGAVVLEANAGASIVPHRYPAYGQPRSVAERIADEVLFQRF